MKYRKNNILFFFVIILFIISCKKEVSKPDFEYSSIRLKINEIMTYDSPNWIELYNPTDTDIYMEGFHIISNKHTYTITSGIITAKGFALFFCDAGDFAGHTNFILNNYGGEILVTDRDNKLIDKTIYPSISQAVSYGRKPDGSTNFTFLNLPTPFSTNNPVYYPNQAPQIVEVTMLPETAVANQIVTINVYATDDHNITSLKLYYSYNDFDTIVNFHPSCCDPRKSSAEIKAVGSGTIVNYYIQAVDDSLASTFYPSDAPNTVKSYIVSP